MVKFLVWFLTGSVNNSLCVSAEHCVDVKETAEGTRRSGNGQAKKVHRCLKLKKKQQMV